MPIGPPRTQGRGAAAAPAAAKGAGGRGLHRIVFFIACASIRVFMLSVGSRKSIGRVMALTGWVGGDSVGRFMAMGGRRARTAPFRWLGCVFIACPWCYPA